MPTKRALLVAMLSAAMACAACTAPAPQRSLYERLGGRAAIEAVVADAFDNIAADLRINHHFANTVASQLSSNLVDLICERSGGPCVYRGLDMAAAHEGMQIRDAEFDALVDDLVKSMRKFNVPAREQAEAVVLLAKMRNAIVGH